MDESNLRCSSLSLQKSRPNKPVPSYQLDKASSSNTASTFTDDNSSLDGISWNDKKSTGAALNSKGCITPGKKKIVMSVSALPKRASLNNDAIESIRITKEDSFKVDDDSNWWQSPNNKATTDNGSLDQTTKNEIKSLEQLKVSAASSEDESTIGDDKIPEKKKKVKRISMIKVKASDLNGHQFQKTGDFATDQAELKKMLMKIKSDRKAQENSSDESVPSKPRSKSKMRSSKESTGESTGEHSSRSKSTSRRSSSTEVVDLAVSDKRSKSVSRRDSSDIVDLTASDKRSKSVSRRDTDTSEDETRRSRSVARKHSDDSEKQGDMKEARNRGRSVGKRSSATAEGQVRSKSTARTGKERERSRSVARQRINLDDEDDDSDEVEVERRPRARSVKRSGSEDLASGLAHVDRDTRSRSVARKRPGQEEEEKSLCSNKSSSNGSKGTNSEKGRSKSVSRKMKNNGDDCNSLPSQDRSVGSAGDVSNSSKSIPWNEFLKHAQSGTSTSK